MTTLQLPSQPLKASNLQAAEVYRRVFASVGAREGDILQSRADRLVAAVRRTADRTPSSIEIGRTAERWLLDAFGEIDDRLKRGVVGLLALRLSPDAQRLPGDILCLYATAHQRLARFLAGPRRYGLEALSKDIAFTTGLAAPAGPLSVILPAANPISALPVRTRHAAGSFCRQVRQYGASSAFDWLARAGLNPWAELHVDVRNLTDFNEAGFARCYHRLASLMVRRPDIAGIYGSSWLYDPMLSHISPELGFIRESAEVGGGKLVRLRTDRYQAHNAVANSPRRRKLMEQGQYEPACYGMYWDRRALIDWSREHADAD